MAKNKFISKFELTQLKSNSITIIMNKTQFDILIFYKRKIRLFGILVTLLLSYNCNTTEPPTPPNIPPKSIKLNLIEVSCTEAFIKVTAADTVLPVNITLKKDNAALFSFTLTKKDTVVIDTTLQPNITYTYQTTAQIKGKEENSDTIQVKTLNTTSHNFSWQTFTFGDPEAGSSILNDVAIIDENNIWAVGEIYADTSGEAYNAVHWDGSSWELMRIYFPTVCGSTDSTPYPAKAIFAFANGEIWISSSGDKIAILENGIQIDKFCLPSNVSMSINKIWGKSSNDLYVVGNAGSIAHYQNGSWQKIESGTTTDIREIWGTIEPTSGTLKILATATAINNYKLLTLTSSSSKDTLNWQTNKSLSGIWLAGIRTYAAGADIWKNENNTWHQETSTGFFFTRVRGSKCNNIYGIGPDGTVHFNGSKWQIIKPRPEGLVIVSGDCNNNIIVTVGFASSGGLVGKAVIMLGAK